jgi:hypothetical protein
MTGAGEDNAVVAVPRGSRAVVYTSLLLLVIHMHIVHITICIWITRPYDISVPCGRRRDTRAWGQPRGGGGGGRRLRVDRRAVRAGRAPCGPARAGSSVHSVFHTVNRVLRDGFVWGRRALNRGTRRFPGPGGGAGARCELARVTCGSCGRTMPQGEQVFGRRQFSKTHTSGYPVILMSLECRVSELVSSDARPRPTPHGTGRARGGVPAPAGAVRGENRYKGGLGGLTCQPLGLPSSFAPRTTYMAYMCSEGLPKPT